MKHIALAAALSFLPGSYVFAQGYQFGNSVLNSRVAQTEELPLLDQPLSDTPSLQPITDGATREMTLDAMPLAPTPRTTESATEKPMAPVPDVSNSAPSLNAMQTRTGIAPPVVSQHDPNAPEPPAQPIPGQPQAKQVQGHSHVGHVHQHGHMQSGARYYRVKKKQNVFQKLMEMERKKNAWLKRTFLGK
ncbi:MAG: hypothetical protein AAFV88_11840 [Planctomycetota bacterium]